MSKYLEVLEKFLDDYLTLCEKLHTNQQEKMLLDKNSPYNVLKTYLESIDNANPSEALECFENMQNRIASNISTIEYTTIKQALLKAQEPKQYVDELKLVEKKLKALEIIKKLFNPKEYNFLELYENPFITIGEKGEKYRIDSTDDSYIHIGIPKEEFNLLKEVLE